MSILKRINWTNTLFLTITPVVAIIATFFIVKNGNLHWATVLLAFVMTGLTGLSITAGYHRLFSHRTYKTIWPVRLLLLLFGAATFEGSVMEWSTDHRNHHRYTDTDKDPYNIKKGFWYAHIGWLFVLDTSKRDFSNVEDLAADRLVMLQHRFFVPIAIFMGFVFPMALGALWGDAWGGLIIAGALRIVFNQQMTFCINSVCHVFGKRTYSNQQSARDNWITALFTYGEGYHNFHHQFAVDYRNGIRFYDYDPAKWLIRTLAFFGWATDLKQVRKEQIIRYQLRSHENPNLTHSHVISEYARSFSAYIQRLRERILEVALQIEQLEQDYQRLKKEKIQYLKGKMSEYRTHLYAQREHLKKARRELKSTLTVWSNIVRHQNQLGLVVESGR
ncbi:MAG TPA: fatty acid desaturase [Gammaproteobacteria bacterium]|nr:fatty acid desaturase [Gammaproteobacteria bacterium]